MTGGGLGGAVSISQEEMAEIQAGLEHFHRDVMYLQEHYEELLDRYPEHWVAVYDQSVVGVDTDPERLIEQLRARGVPPEHTVREYLTREEVIWII